MQISTFLAFLSAFIATASATSSADNLDKHRRGCLTNREVNILRNRWLNFFVNFDATLANQSFVDEFKLYSEGNKLLIPGFAGAGDVRFPSSPNYCR